ncbi:transcriptional regulator, LuxR family [Limimonas halophila]|uniref:Transcriptional regulator, LuxR family n=1 Tax=Limimonas halophila TaxID=1082479 RepID=A0A1G7LVD1_9PROT|nr:LuxR C-terminal-related transcriptional regulator [Limimonas halophila]SDF53336.1 transcriptional regulator, LuxR family [Limimonas halophila]
MHMPDALARASTASTLAEIDAVFRDLAEAIGGCAWAYADIALLPDQPGEYVAACRDTIPEDFQKTYVQNKCFFIDPCIRRAYIGSNLFTWSQLAEWRMGHARGNLPDRHGASVMRLAFDHGFSDGIVIPLHGDTADIRPSCALLSVFLDSYAQDDVDPSIRAWLPVVSQAAHTRLGEIMPERLGAIRRVADLSDRERDILGWAAQGYTAEETATGLTISARTVEKHLQIAMQKLGAAHKAHAVALALSRGLISL